MRPRDRFLAPDDFDSAEDLQAEDTLPLGTAVVVGGLAVLLIGSVVMGAMMGGYV